MRVAIIVLALVALVGCSGQQVNNPQMAQVGIQLVAYNVGYVVGKDRSQVDVAIRDAYTLARTGTLSPEQLASALAELKVTDPLLMGNCVIALKAMGAGFTPTGQLINIKGITPEIWDAAKEGYVQGFELGKIQKKG